MASSASNFKAKLALDIVHFHFGEIVYHVSQELVVNGPLTLPELVAIQSSKRQASDPDAIEATEVRTALLVLLTHRLVNVHVTALNRKPQTTKKPADNNNAASAVPIRYSPPKYSVSRDLTLMAAAWFDGVLCNVVLPSAGLCSSDTTTEVSPLYTALQPSIGHSSSTDCSIAPLPFTINESGVQNSGATISRVSWNQYSSARGGKILGTNAKIRVCRTGYGPTPSKEALGRHKGCKIT
eukprot:gb/GECG01006091.1/.p1 GENE.gb/GECG01006091.1/~~gb/GECG01006091.1/.p1  ORF type:complete len:239 (+),score=17.63 gb/GECG01006091.1/:1-717(+)